LRVTGLEIKSKHFHYIGGLVDKVYQDTENSEYVIGLNPELAVLFKKDQFTLIDQKIRQTLNRKALAKWLHGYYASHAEPYPVKVSTLYTLCGCNYGTMFNFRRDLITAFNNLISAYKANDMYFHYEIENDIVYVKKQGNPSQSRHLTKRRKEQSRYYY
jgi:hypothetical protein